MRSKKRITQFTILSAVILLVSFSVVFVLLHRAEHAVDAPGYELNKRINERNQAIAKTNPFGFTDRVRTTEKPKGIFRIAVIGDSYIWGDGLPYEKTWGHKLEKKLLAKYDSIEVMNWGKCGWSTLDEFNFFKQHGKDYNIDLLIIAWVDNDPDMGKVASGWNSDAKNAHPVFYLISPALAQSLLNKENTDAMLIWMKKLYSPENLKDYQAVLNDFRQYLEQNKVNSLVVMTTSCYGDNVKPNFDAAKPMIEKAGFQCLDTYGPSQKKLGRYKPEELMANPVNGHPGDLMTEEFASEVQDYLEQNNYLKNVPKLNPAYAQR